MKLITFFTFLFAIVLNTALAGFYHGEYRLGLFQDTSFDVQKITHVIIVGSAVKEDSNQFFQSGLSRAYRLKELFPDQQVVIMSSPEVRGTDDEKVFSDFNIAVFKTVNENFTGGQLMKELNALERIASINYYGHSSPWGLKLGKKDASFDPTEYTKSLLLLKSKLLPNAYMTISSCNSGFKIAPELSRVLEIPVAGSLTSSLFERIETDGNWYKKDDYHSENYADSNSFSYNQDLPCSLGLCWRMEASRHNYSAYWGNFSEGGLSFFKFFCNFEDNKNFRCEKGMANSLLSFPSTRPLNQDSSIEDFKAVAFDWICSTAKDKNYFGKCVAGINSAIDRGDLVFQSHPGNELICDFKSCQATISCKKKIFGSGPRGGTCTIAATVNEKPINAAREMLSLIKGYKLLKQ
ncbi:MAG: hypothetical protein KBD76_11435 [Bacteriovorax sp.]|nr:hypothetical protein [Bacteriovorax sp.]